MYNFEREKEKISTEVFVDDLLKNENVQIPLKDGFFLSQMTRVIFVSSSGRNFRYRALTLSREDNRGYFAVGWIGYCFDVEEEKSFVRLSSRTIFDLSENVVNGKVMLPDGKDIRLENLRDARQHFEALHINDSYRRLGLATMLIQTLSYLAKNDGFIGLEVIADTTGDSQHSLSENSLYARALGISSIEVNKVGPEETFPFSQTIPDNAIQWWLNKEPQQVVGLY